MTATLGRLEAQEFLAEMASYAPSDAQQLMARLNGNDMRGNERAASQHARNCG